MAKKQPKIRPLVGWRERVLLGDLSPVLIKAKIDTGARTSSLHAFNLAVIEQNGEPWAEFEIHPVQRSKAAASRVSIPIQKFKRVRSSTGHSENRPVIRTVMQIGSYSYKIDITLTSRDAMGFRMLLGRAAVSRRFLVDPGQSFLHPAPTEPAARRRAPQA